MAELKLYNTLTRKKEPFVPLDAANVRMYVCGPTVYDFAHIGNARPVIVFDVLFRLLRHLYGAEHVTYARNITDVDDKINKRAFERWDRKSSLTQAIRHLTDGTLAQFHEDIDALGALRPTHEPRATDYVCDGAKPLDMVRIIEKLIANGNAYEAEKHVLFNVPSMPGYGALAKRPKDDMIAGARVDVAPYKRDPMDFVLWKPSDPETEPGWESPWGYGRPGWHIECSAMSGALLGEVFDIHAGGLDLIFPHHENEIAQSCCAFGTPGRPNPLMAQVWMHNGFLQVEGQKMSKSLGNFTTIADVLKDWPGEVVRFNMLRTHYRQPIDWTIAGLEESERALRRFARQCSGSDRRHGYGDGSGDGSGVGIGTEWGDGYGGGRDSAKKDFIKALQDDLNTPFALTIMHEMDGQDLKGAMDLLGLAGEFIDPRVERFDETFINALITARLAAREAKDWKKSDRIRDELLAMGIQIMDSKDYVSGKLQTTWEVKR